MTIKTIGIPNYQRFAETWLSLIAGREGKAIVPGTVRVKLKGDSNGNDQSVAEGFCQSGGASVP